MQLAHSQMSTICYVALASLKKLLRGGTRPPPHSQHTTVPTIIAYAQSVKHHSFHSLIVSSFATRSKISTFQTTSLNLDLDL